MSDAAEIVRRLRDGAKCWPLYPEGIADEAADTIEELQRRIDAALALLKRFGPKAIAAYNIEVCDLVRDVKLALTTEEQER